MGELLVDQVDWLKKNDESYESYELKREVMFAQLCELHR